jgi:D-alanine-D-alanine ligase-like ATP-grasp enzyme
LAEQCCAFAEAAGLVLAGFDFRRTPSGQYRCLEMNPVPSFLPYEFASGLPIGAAVVDALTRQQVHLLTSR